MVRSSNTTTMRTASSHLKEPHGAVCLKVSCGILPHSSRKQRWKMIMLTLLLLTVASGGAESKHHQQQQQQQQHGSFKVRLTNMTLDRWLDKNGKPLYKNIYCDGTLRAAQPMSAASQALDAICDHNNPLYFSESGLDSFLSSRFGGHYSHGTGLWRSAASSTPFSTEPNIPWMLADYVITYAAEQRRADSWKRVQAEAQVDLLLCSDQKCKVLIDLQTVTITSENGTDTPPFRGAAFSGLARSPRFGVGASTATHITNTPTLLTRNEWVPAFFRSMDSKDRPMIAEVQYKVAKNGFVLKSPHSDTTLLDFTSSARYTSHGSVADPQIPVNEGWALWQSMKFGHYKARPSEWIYQGSSEPEGEHYCVTVVWPENAWMESHGWGVSDPNCTAGSSSSTSSNGPLDHQVIVFDSYFPQLHILGGQVKVKYNVYVDMSNDQDGFHIEHPGQKIPVYWTLVAQVVVPKAAKHWGRASSPVFSQTIQKTAFYADGPMIQPAGDYGKTYASYGGVTTHEGAGCINATNLDNDMCSTWVIGTASIAAADSFNMSSPQLDRLLKAFLFYSKHENGSANGSSLPWCSDVAADAAVSAGKEHRNIVIWVEGVSPATVPQPNLVGIDKSNWTEVDRAREAVNKASRQLHAADVLSNCSFWDERGVGYVHGAHQQPNGSSAEWLTSTLQYWVNLSAKATGQATNQSESSEFFDPFLPLDADGLNLNWLPGPEHHPVFLLSDLDHAIQELVADATRLLHEQANDELAITDMVKSAAGALMDITVTIVAVVAMASGHADMYSWIRGKLQWLGNHLLSQALLDVVGSDMAVIAAAKLLTVVIVIMGLVVSPAFILAGDIKAGENNNDGSSSQVGLLPSAFTNVVSESEPLVLIATVTVRITTDKNDAARALLVLNLVLASAAAVLVCVSIITPSKPRSLKRQLAKARWRFQDDSSMPHSS